MNVPHLGHRFDILPQSPSTNLHAMEQIHARLAEHGQVFFTTHQTEGRGQRGKEWHAQAGQNIAMSLILDTSAHSGSVAFFLSAAMALGVHDGLKNLANGTLRIKWPNDIFINDRKAGGILIENQFQGPLWKHSVVGIGLNVNQEEFPPHLPQAVSLRQVSGQTLNPETLAKALCPFLEQRWQQFARGAHETLLADYNQVLYGLNEHHWLRKGNMIFPCLISGVTAQGRLLAGTYGEWLFEHGEVEWTGRVEKN